jgi:hypothetical protein
MMKKKQHVRNHATNKKKNIKKTVISHLKKDMQDFKKEMSEDKVLIKKLDHKHKDPKKKDPKPKTKAGKREKVKIVMEEFKAGKLHSGSKNGPLVTNPRQALAISLSEAGLSKKKSKKRK